MDIWTNKNDNNNNDNGNDNDNSNDNDNDKDSDDEDEDDDDDDDDDYGDDDDDGDGCDDDDDDDDDDDGNNNKINVQISRRTPQKSFTYLLHSYHSILWMCLLELQKKVVLKIMHAPKYHKNVTISFIKPRYALWIALLMYSFTIFISTFSN